MGNCMQKPTMMKKVFSKLIALLTVQEKRTFFDDDKNSSEKFVQIFFVNYQFIIL